jgi:predicted nucleic-acid-binding protein
MDASAGCFVPITVALELEWVLRGAYQLPREGVITAFEGLLAIRGMARQGMDFADALHLARSVGCGALVSFDLKLAQVAGHLTLQPRVQSP